MLSRRNLLGYRTLRTWQQANEIFELTEKYAATLPVKHPMTGQYLTDLKDQIIRSGRSGVRNIEEGYVRTSTKEYISFLGFSLGAIEELLNDFKYCQKAKLGDLELCSKLIGLCVGEAKMLDSQIKSLERKMTLEKTTSPNDRAQMILNENTKKEKEFDEYLKDVLRKSGKNYY